MNDFKTGDKLYSNKHNMWFTIIYIFEDITTSTNLHIRSDEKVKGIHIHIGKGIRYSDIGVEYLTKVQYKAKRRNSIIRDLL